MTQFIEFPLRVNQGDKPETVAVNINLITSVKSRFNSVNSVEPDVCYINLSADHHSVALSKTAVLNIIKQAEQPYQTK